MVKVDCRCQKCQEKTFKVDMKSRKCLFLVIFMILEVVERLANIFYLWILTKVSKSVFFEFLAQKASKVIISLFSGFWESSMKMRGSFLSKGGTQSWPGTAIVNHPLRQQARPRLSYFPYIFYFVNFTISAAIRQGLFGSFENVIKKSVFFWHFWTNLKNLPVFFTSGIEWESSKFEVFGGWNKDAVCLQWILDKSWWIR